MGMHGRLPKFSMDGLLSSPDALLCNVCLVDHGHLDMTDHPCLYAAGTVGVMQLVVSNPVLACNTGKRDLSVIANCG
jgi:hypothetical protein